MQLSGLSSVHTGTTRRALRSASGTSYSLLLSTRSSVTLSSTLDRQLYPGGDADDQSTPRYLQPDHSPSNSGAPIALAVNVGIRLRSTKLRLSLRRILQPGLSALCSDSFYCLLTTVRIVPRAAQPEWVGCGPYTCGLTLTAVYNRNHLP